MLFAAGLLFVSILFFERAAAGQVTVNDNDTRIEYSCPHPGGARCGTWATANDLHFTPGPEATVTLKFNGTGIVLFGDLEGAQLTASVLVDDVSTPLNEAEGSDGNPSTQLFSMVGLDPAKEHTFLLTMNRTSPNAPFTGITVDFFHITQPNSSTPPAGSGAPTGPAATQPAATERRVPVPAILGAVLGSIALLISLAAIRCTVLRARRRARPMPMVRDVEAPPHDAMIAPAVWLVGSAPPPPRRWDEKVRQNSHDGSSTMTSPSTDAGGSEVGGSDADFAIVAPPQYEEQAEGWRPAEPSRSKAF